jgi:predicted XRE-type DNA-binding protein
MELQAKAELARQVYLIIKIKKRGLTQMTAAQLLGLRQPDVSLLMRGRLSRFSTDRLIQMLNVLDRDVEIVVKRKSSSQAESFAEGHCSMRAHQEFGGPPKTRLSRKAFKTH